MKHRSSSRLAGNWLCPPELWEGLKSLARQKRKEPTEAEERLWGHLRNHQLSGYKFRRQHAIERFIVDFYCAEAELVVEVDGAIHEYRPEEDKIRAAFIEGHHLRILRFPNEDVLNHLDYVVEVISRALVDQHEAGRKWD